MGHECGVVKEALEGCLEGCFFEFGSKEGGSR